MKLLAAFAVGLLFGALVLFCVPRYSVTVSPLVKTRYDHDFFLLIKLDRWTGKTWQSFCGDELDYSLTDSTGPTEWMALEEWHKSQSNKTSVTNKLDLQPVR